MHVALQRRLIKKYFTMNYNENPLYDQLIRLIISDCGWCEIWIIHGEGVGWITRPENDNQPTTGENWRIGGIKLCGNPYNNM